MSLFKKVVSIKFHSFSPSILHNEHKYTEWFRTSFYGTVRITYFSVLFGGLSVEHPLKFQYCRAEEFMATRTIDVRVIGRMARDAYQVSTWEGLYKKLIKQGEEGEFKNITDTVSEYDNIEWVDIHGHAQ